MKTMIIRTLAIFVAIAVISCSGDKQAKLAKLKKEQTKIAEEIKWLESQMTPVDSSAILTANAKRESVMDLKTEVFKHYIEVQGKLDGEDNVGLSARTQGVVVTIYGKVGDHVKKDQVLAKLDDAVLQKSLQEVKTRLDYATEMFDKQQKLWDQHIGSEVQYLNAKNAKEVTENSMKTIQDQIDMTRIKSPIDGTIEDAPLKIGQSVAPGIPAFRVVNFNALKVVADIAEAYADKIKDGDDVKLFFPDLQSEVTGKINFASRYINPTSRTFQVEVHFTPGSGDYKANMISILKINDYKSDKAIIIPISLLQNDQSGEFVYLADQKDKRTIVKRTGVTSGKTYNGNVEIISGLKDGDKIITTGQYDLVDGEQIRL